MINKPGRQIRWSWYCKPRGFKVQNSETRCSCGIGIDALPEQVRSSHILTGNDLARLGMLEVLPSHSELEEFINPEDLITKLETAQDKLICVHTYVKSLISTGHVDLQ